MIIRIIFITMAFSCSIFSALFAMDGPHKKLKIEQERENKCSFNRWALKQITDNECENFIFPKEIRDYIGQFDVALDKPISFQCPTVQEFQTSLDHAIKNDEIININENTYSNGIKIFPGKYLKITFQNSDGIVFVGYTRYFYEKGSWLDRGDYREKKYNFSNTQLKIGHKNIYFDEVNYNQMTYNVPKFKKDAHPIVSISCLYGHVSNPKSFDDRHKFVELVVDFEGMQLNPSRISYQDDWDYEKEGSTNDTLPFLFYTLNQAPTFKVNK